MENYFDNQFQFLKQFDARAQSKPQRKKKWLLSRQYLQPLNEPEDEDSSQRDQDDSVTGYKKKLKCAYEAAKYGMKEGVLTGIFLGGCWGILKQLGETFPINFLSSGRMGKGNAGEKNGAGFRAQKHTSRKRSDVRDKPPLKNAASQETSRNSESRSSDLYRKSITSNTKSVAVVREKSLGKNYYNAATADQLIYKLANSKLPIRSSKNLVPLRSDGVGIHEINNFNFRERREKVEIVGYTFVQRMGSVTRGNTGSNSSSGSNSPKNTESKTQEDDGNKKEGFSSDKKRTKSGQSVRSGSGAGSSVKGSRQSIKTDEKFGKSSSVNSGSVLPDVVEETQSAGTNYTSDIESSEKGNDTSSYVKQRLVDQSDTILDSSPERSIYKQQSKISGISSTTYSSNTSYQEAQKAKAGRKAKKNMSRASSTPSTSENIYPSPKDTGSILVNIDSLSNGYTSPQQEIVFDHTEESPESEPPPGQNQVEHVATSNASFLGSKSSDYNDTSSVDYAHYTENGQVYRVESSPKFERSYISNRQEEGKRDSIPHDASLVSDKPSRRYVVKSSPTYHGSIVSETQEKSRYNFKSRSHVNETSEERSRSDEGLDESDFGSGGSPPYHKAHVSETQETGFILESSPTYTKSYVSATSVGSAVRSVPDREYVSNTEDKHNRSEYSKHSASLFSGRGRHSRSGSVEGQAAARKAEEDLGNSRHSRSLFSGKGRQSRYGSAEGQKAARGSDYSASLFEENLGNARQSQQSLFSGKGRQSRYGSAEGQKAARGSDYSASLFEENLGNARQSQSLFSGQGKHSPAQEQSTRDYSMSLFEGQPSNSLQAAPTEGGPAGAAPKAAPTRSEKPSRGLSFLSAVNENIIVLSACNCAIVLGILCSVISTTRASLAV